MNITKPVNDYDPAWIDYWAAHPNELRAVGAEVAEEGGEEQVEESTGSDQQQDGGEQQAESAEDSQAESTDTTDWRAPIEDEKLRSHADRFSSPADLVRAHLDLRQKLSKAIVPPGKDASEEDVAAYRKALGVPESPEGYKFPELPEDQLTDDVKASRETWAGRFHELGVSADVAMKLSEMVNKDQQAFMEAEARADKEFADEQMAALKSEWGKDADVNMKFANRALVDIAGRVGVDMEDLKGIQGKDGRFLLDHAPLAKVFAEIGREMGEGTLGGGIDESAREGLENQVSEIREQIEKARSEGNNKKANDLYQKEQALLAKISGNQPVVGAAGRSV